MIKNNKDVVQWVCGRRIIQKIFFFVANLSCVHCATYSALDAEITTVNPPEDSVSAPEKSAVHKSQEQNNLRFVKYEKGWFSVCIGVSIR